jgi:hypothetical protein
MTDHADALYSDFSVMRKNRCTAFIAGANDCRRLYTIKIAGLPTPQDETAVILGGGHKKAPPESAGLS